MLYHKVQEVPVELLERAKRAQKPTLTPGEKLFKDVLSEDDDFDDCCYTDLDENGRRKKFKAFTLCLICNPTACGYDQVFNSWKNSSRSAIEKTKKIVVSSSSYANAISGV